MSFAADTFVRANQSGWGTASDGETYTTSGAYTFAIVSNEGKITANSTASVNVAWLGTNTIQDGVVFARVQGNNTAHDYAVLFRGNGTSTYYMASMNAGTLEILKVVAGTITSLASVAETFTANTFYWIKFQCQGTSPTTLSAKWWQDGNAEPGSYQVTITDSTASANLQGAGRYGIRVKLGSTDTAQWDHFEVDTLLANNPMTSEDDLVASDSFLVASQVAVAESLVAADTLGMAAAYRPAEALVATDTLATQLSFVPIEALTAGDVFLASGGGIFLVEALTAGDVFLASYGYVAIEALVAGDNAFYVQRSNATESLSSSDSLVAADAFTAAPEALTIQDSLLATVNAALVVDALSILDSYVSLASYVAVEALVATDLQSALQAWNVDALSATDSFVVSDTALLIEALAVLDLLNGSTGYSAVENNVASDALNVTDTTLFSDALAISDSKPLTAYSSLILADAPLRYYRLGERSGSVAVDLGSQGQNGTIVGGVTEGVQGLIAQDPNTAMSFNGTSGYISVPTTGLPTGAQPWSMEAWVRMPNPLPAIGTFNAVANFGTTSGNQYVDLFYRGSVSKFEVDDWTSTVVQGTTTPVAGATYYLAVTYDGSTARLYVNGNLEVSAAKTFAIGSGGAQIGNDQAGDFWQGVIGEVAFHPRALTALDVAAHYNTGLSTYAPMQQSYQPIDALSPTDALSTSTNYIVTEVDAASDALNVTDTTLAINILSVLDGFLANEAYTASESSIIADAFGATQNFTAIESLTPADTLLTAQRSNFIEANSASDALTIAIGFVPVEGLSVIDGFLVIDGYSMTELLSAADGYRASDGFSAVAGLTVNDAIQAAQLFIAIEALSASDGVVTQGSYGASAILSIADTFIGSDATLFVETLSIADLFSGTSIAVLAKIFTALLLAGRDGTVTLRGRDGKLTLAGRDGTLSLRGY